MGAGSKRSRVRSATCSSAAAKCWRKPRAVGREVPSRRARRDRSRSIPSRRWTGQSRPSMTREAGSRSRWEKGFAHDRTAWLIVDGSLAESRAFARGRPDARVSRRVTRRSPSAEPDLETYLRLAPGRRTSVFQPSSRRFAPVYAWGTPALALGRA
jgi:hypothetical protein